MTTDLQRPCTADRRERGSIVVIALVLLVLLTIIGISASRTTEIEIMIAGNERIAKQNLYLAEGAAMRAVQVMDDAELTIPSSLNWVADKDDSPTIRNVIYDDNTWADDPGYPIPVNIKSQVLTVYDGLNAQVEARALALSRGVPAQTSLTDPTIPYDYEVYGRNWWRRGEGFVAIGYRGLLRP